MPLNMGLQEVGVIKLLKAKVALEDVSNSQAEITIGTLPAGALVFRTVVEVVEPFDAETNTLTVGTDDASDAGDDTLDNLLSADDVDANVKGFYEKSTPVQKRVSESTPIKVRYGYAGVAPTQGQAIAYVKYVEA